MHMLSGQHLARTRTVQLSWISVSTRLNTVFYRITLLSEWIAISFSLPILESSRNFFRQSTSYESRHWCGQYHFWQLVPISVEECWCWNIDISCCFDKILNCLIDTHITEKTKNCELLGLFQSITISCICRKDNVKTKSIQVLTRKRNVSRYWRCAITSTFFVRGKWFFLLWCLCGLEGLISYHVLTFDYR